MEANLKSRVFMVGLWSKLYHIFLFKFDIKN